MRVIESKQLQYGEDAVSYCKIAGLSTEDKPTSGIATGSEYLEVNTGDTYVYDEDGEKWWKLGGS